MIIIIIEFIIALVVDLIHTLEKLEDRETKNELHTHQHTADEIIITSRTGHAGINYTFFEAAVVFDCCCLCASNLTPLESFFLPFHFSKS